MKKIKLALSLCLLAVLIFAVSASASAQGQIFVDLQEVVSDTPPQFVNNRTLVPVRAIGEMLGYDVIWQSETMQVHVCEKGSTIPMIAMTIGDTKAYYTKYEEELGDSVGVEAILDVPATAINNRTFVPLRFISEAVGYVVEYIEESGDIYLFSPEYIKNHQGEGKGGEPGGTGDDGIGGLGIAEDGIGEKPDGINADGIGSVIPLTMEEMTYVLEQTTETWLAMTDEEKDSLVVLIGRWWEDYENVIVEDYDEMVECLNHQMEQYHKNGVDENLFVTVCDIYQIDKNIYIEK